jgi:hypothetical protein
LKIQIFQKSILSVQHLKDINSQHLFFVHQENPLRGEALGEQHENVIFGEIIRVFSDHKLPACCQMSEWIWVADLTLTSILQHELAVIALEDLVDNPTAESARACN